MRVLITGAGGFVGSFTAARFAREGHEVANHTHSHGILVFARPSEITHELLRTHRLLSGRFIGAMPKLLASQSLVKILPVTWPLSHCARFSAVARQSGWERRRHSEFEAAAGSEVMIILSSEVRKHFFSVPLFDCR